MSDNKKYDDATYEGVISDDSAEQINGGFHYNIPKRKMAYTDKQGNIKEYDILVDVNLAVNFRNTLSNQDITEEEALQMMLEKGYISPIG